MKSVKKIPRHDFAGKTQIPRVGSKFRGPRKTVGPKDDNACSYRSAVLPCYSESLTSSACQLLCPSPCFYISVSAHESWSHLSQANRQMDSVRSMYSS